MKKILYFLAPLLLAFKAKADIEIPQNTGLPDPGNGVLAVLSNFTSWLLTIFMSLAVLSFIISGLMYIFALGDSRSETLEKAKKNFIYSIIAVITVGSAYIIISFIDRFLDL